MDRTTTRPGDPTARRHGTGGFVIFNYGVNEANDLLPMLGLGITKR